MNLTHSPAQILMQYLINSTMGILIPTNLSSADKTLWYLNHTTMPTEPDNLITCIHYTNQTEGRLMAGERIVKPFIQVLIRSLQNNAGYTKGIAIQTLFDSVDYATITLESTTYQIQAVHVRNPLYFLMKEELRNRSFHTMDVLVTLKQLA